MTLLLTTISYYANLLFVTLVFNLYRFHYDIIKNQYPEAKLLFTDTDSLYYDVKTANLEKELFLHKELFDYSGYPEKSEYFNESNKKVIGKFKCESRGNPIEKFLGLRPKMYSYVFDDKCGDKPKRVEKHRAIGIAKAAA